MRAYTRCEATRFLFAEQHLAFDEPVASLPGTDFRDSYFLRASSEEMG